MLRYSRKPTLLILILVFAAAMHESYALEFTADYRAIDNNIVYGTGSAATYTITIKNTGTQPKTINIRTLDSIDWEVSVKPSINNRVELAPGEEGVYIMRITEVKKDGKYSRPVGTYKLTVVTESEADKISLPLYVNIASESSLVRNYQPDVIATAELTPRKIDPRNKPNLKIYLKNQNLRNITRLDIILRSDRGLVSQSSVASLGPLEEKILDYTINIEPDESPKRDILFVKIETLSDTGEVFPKKQPDPLEFEIIPYSTIRRDMHSESKFMKKETEIIVSNEGNTRKETDVKVDTSIFERLFTTTEPKARFVKEEGEYYFAWNVQLEAKENDKVDTKILKITNNYRPIIVILAAGIFAIVFYYRFRSPIVIRKDVAKILTKEGGIAGLKIILHLKNRGSRTIENIKLLDKVPSIAELEKNFEIGTLKPSSITKGRTTTSVMWEIASLEPFEERMITYHIRSKLSVLGGFDLPHAVAKYVGRRGKEAVVTSNKIDLSKRLIE